MEIVNRFVEVTSYCMTIANRRTETAKRYIEITNHDKEITEGIKKCNDF